MKKRSKLLFGFCALIVAMVAMSLVAFGETQQKPGTVTGLKQTDANTSSVDIQWDADITPDCRYEVWMSTTGQEGSFILKEDSCYNAKKLIDGLTAGKTYYVKVRAFTSTGYGTNEVKMYADNYSAVIPVVTKPNEAKNVKQTAATTSSVTLNWDKVEGATGYYIYNESGSNKKLIADVATNTATIKGLKATGSYTFVVYSYRKAGSYAAVNTWGTSIYNSSIKLIPSKVSARKIVADYYWSSIKEINIKWNPTTRAEGYQVCAYNYNSSKPVFTKTVSYENCTIEKMVKNKFFKVKIRAYTVVNGVKKYGAWSDFKYIAQQPDIISMKQVGRKKQIKVRWDTVKGATGYTVYASTKQKSGYKKITTTKKTSFTLSKIGKTSLKKNRTYYVYVVANRKVGKTTYTSGAQYCNYIKLK